MTDPDRPPPDASTEAVSVPGRPLIVVAEELEPAPRAWLDERAEVVSCPQTDRGRFEALMERASGLVVRTYTQVTREVLEGAPRLRAVARPGVGLENVDLDACLERGVRVLHTPGANASAVAELVFAFLLDALRPRVFLDKPLDLIRWKELREELTGTRQLAEMTLGVCGLGHVGSLVAKAARGFGVRTIYHDIRDIDEANRHGATPVTRDNLLRESDIVTVHIDERPTNRHLFDADAFGRLKGDAVFINTARGLVVDPVACADFFLNHPTACAMLDVHEPEPISETSPLLDIPNVHLSPHIGGATTLAKTQMSWVVRDLWRVLTGEEPEHAAV